MTPSKMIEQVLKTVRAYEMVFSGDKILVCVSGGPDSIFMLHALARLQKKLAIRLAVCNLDHGIRGQESENDSFFVLKETKKLGLDCFYRKIRVSGKPEKKISLEEKARDARYSFFYESAKRAGAAVMATGHTLSDQAETVIMRIIKGTSLKGAAGIPPVRMFRGIRIIRPLIEITREDIKQFLLGGKIQFRVDSTNKNEKYFRNVTRNRILPFLKQYNPKIERSLFNFAHHLREDADFISHAKAACSRTIMRRKTGFAQLPLKEIVLQPRALQKEILRDALRRSGGVIKKLTYRHWKEIEATLRMKRTGASLHLPGGVRLTRTKDALVFDRLRK